MKKLNTICTIAIFLFTFVVGTAAANAKSLYDDFSGNYLDSTKWSNKEFVREVLDGKLILKSATSSDSSRNLSTFRTVELINAIQAEVTVVNGQLEEATSAYAEARLDGHFYNTLSSGDDMTGDVFAAVRIVKDGNGLKADYIIVESLDGNFDTWKLWDEGTISTGLSYNQQYTLKVEYDNVLNKFVFTADSSSVVVESASLPAYSRDPVLQSLNLTTGINDAEPGVNFIHALFDNVYINNEVTVYDDFTTAPLDQTKWKNPEFVREIDNDKLRLSSHSTGDIQNVGLSFAEIHPYTEAIITIKSNSQLEPGEKGIARIDGFFYNDTYGPGSYNGREGNVWIGVSLDYDADNGLRASCSGSKMLNAEATLDEQLFFKQFHVPIIFDRAYKLSIHFDGSIFRFACQDTVTGREDIHMYTVTTDVYEPYDKYTRLLSRVWGYSAGGYMATEFDNVYVDVAEPPSIYDANGHWTTTGSSPWSTCDEVPTVEDDTIEIKQDGKDISLIVPGDDGEITLTGSVIGDTYRFMRDVTVEGDREVTYGVIHLSQSTSGVGSVTIHNWDDGVYQCVSGFNITLTKLADDDDGGDGGGGGCFISTMDNSL